MSDVKTARAQNDNDEIVKEISRQIQDNKEQIFEKVGVTSIAAHQYIQKHRGTPEDPMFQFVFCEFYQIRFPDETWRKKFFSLFKESSLSRLLQELKLGSETVHFSFATKLLHTANPQLPIYDNVVRQVLKMSPISGKDRESKCEKTYRLLKDQYEALLKDTGVIGAVNEFKKRFNAHDITDEKALDFLLWGLGKWQKVS